MQKVHGNKGKIHSVETRRRMSLAKKGRVLSEETKGKMSLVKKGKKPNNYGMPFSEKTRLKMSLARRGNKNHLWKGGVSPIKKLIRASMKYTEWRQRCFMRDDFTCQQCDLNGGYLHAHHKKAFSVLIQEAKKYLPLFPLYEACMLYSPLWDMKNGITLCNKCHFGGHSNAN